MKCDNCGMEITYPTNLSFHSERNDCIATLSAQLGDEMNRLIDGLHDLSVAKDDAEAKLATAVEALQKAARWADDNKIFYHHVGGPGCASDVLHEIGKAALNTLRALGIDPSKETP